MHHQEYDIIIIGAGTAGMACAITAAEHGTKVLVIEKDDKIGGALHWSGGHMSAGGTKRQKAKGISDSPEVHLADIKRINGGSGDWALTQMAVAEAPHTIDWLDELGFEFAPECPRIIYGHVPYTAARTHYGIDKAMSIYKVLKPLWDDGVASGHITIMLEHSLAGLIRDEDRYKGVKLRTRDNTIEAYGHHIVLATGGYGSAPTYFRSKHPGVPMVSSAYPMASAEGHQLAEQEGAVFRFADHHLPSLGGLEIPPGSGRCNFNEAWAMVLTSVYRQPREVYVNAQGARFMDEGEINADTRERIVVQQPDWKFWLIFDETSLLERNEDGVENPIIIGWDTERIKAEAQQNRSIFTANSIIELAQKTGLPEKTLAQTITTYNNYTDAGHDPDFGRTYLENKVSEPPFYALLVHASLLVTFGGLQVNNHFELIDVNGHPLPGLYAIGEILGLGATSGSAFCSGMAITPALSFGRILGRTLRV